MKLPIFAALAWAASSHGAVPERRHPANSLGVVSPATSVQVPEAQPWWRPMEDAMESARHGLGDLLHFPSALVPGSRFLALVDAKQQPTEMGGTYEESQRSAEGGAAPQQHAQEQRAKPKKLTSQQRWDNLMGLGLWSATMAVIWIYFIKKKPQRQPGFEWEQPDDFAFDLLAIEKKSYRGEDCCMICLCSAFCPCIRWAETLSYVRPFLPFWLLWAVYCVLYLAKSYFDGEKMVVPTLLVWSLLAGICAFFRQELRFAYNLKLGPQSFPEGSSMVWALRLYDCLMYCFLPCCTIAQEARHVELSMKCGHEAVAPWPEAMPEEGSRV